MKVSTSNFKTVRKHLHFIQINIYFNWHKTVLIRATKIKQRGKAAHEVINKTKMTYMEGASVSFMKLTIFGKNLRKASHFAANQSLSIPSKTLKKDRTPPN